MARKLLTHLEALNEAVKARCEAFEEAVGMFYVTLGDGSKICLLCHCKSHNEAALCKVAKLEARAKREQQMRDDKGAPRGG